MRQATNRRCARLWAAWPESRRRFAPPIGWSFRRAWRCASTISPRHRRPRCTRQQFVRRGWIIVAWRAPSPSPPPRRSDRANANLRPISTCARAAVQRHSPTPPPRAPGSSARSASLRTTPRRTPPRRRLRGYLSPVCWTAASHQHFRIVAAGPDIHGVGDFGILRNQAGLPIVRPVRDLHEVRGLLAEGVTAAALHDMKAFRSNEESMWPEHRFQFRDGRMIVRDDLGRQLIQHVLDLGVFELHGPISLANTVNLSPTRS